MTDNTPSSIRETLTRLLARREHSERELYQKLQQRGISAQELSPILEQFKQRGWQSNLRFAESFVRQRIAKGQGQLRIRNELRERGVEDSAVNQALAEQDVDWFELAKTVHDKKFSRDALPLTAQQKQKHQRYLQYRGFSPDQIQYACSCEFSHPGFKRKSTF
ncbi:recombination regulator RecX [Neptunicella marina]|uniref:Regulatory protein RecX n=1 Tax=Neptunicella marina TaxID=2125989 RepID=A0A8J6M0W0_9ALTE|nr:recombination regulator RecX [Neptunicella marina]MBC3765082.1 recombination regulator RecX [Neptunicella marina]